MRRGWPDLLQRYVELGGTLIVEGVPGWRLDLAEDYVREWERRIGDAAPGTLQFARLSGIRFRYNPRGAVTRIRLMQQHPLTEGLEQAGQWLEIPWTEGTNNYGYLAYPVTAESASVLIEAEHEACPYDGVAYVRRGTINGVYPLLTVQRVGKGTVIRHYAHVALPTVLGQERFEAFCANLVKFVETQYNAAVTD